MPRVGPGDDNITGDRYTLDLGVEPDLGNLLQNLQVANDLLDAAEQKFRSISDVVNSSTQRMAQFTRQTALAAAEAQRLQNSYGQIAASSFTLANIGGMAMGGGMAGGMGGYFPGQQAFGGMPPAASGGSNMIQTMPSGMGGVGEAGEDIAEFSRPGPPKKPNLQLLQANAIEQMTSRFGGRSGGPVSTAVNRLRYGFQMARHGPGGVNAAIKEGANLIPKIPPNPVTGNVISGAENAVGMAGMAGEAGALGSIGAAAGMAAPWVLAGIAGYKLYAGQEAEARRLSGITGNTGLFSGVAGGGSVNLKARSIMMGLRHPGVDYGRIQEEAMGTGAIGETYDQTRDFLFEAAKRGMSETVDMVDLYREGVQKAGGSTAQLTDSIDYLKSVAAGTNANLTAMTKNFKANMEMYTAMGLGGSTAMATSLMQSTANAKYSPIAQANPSLINSNGLDITNPYLRAQVTANLGINYNQLGTTATLNPVMAGNLPMLTEKAGIEALSNYGFKKGMSYEEVIKNFQDSGLGDMAGTVFASMGLIPPDVDPNNIRDVAMSIQSTLSAPVAQATAELNKAGDEQDLGSITRAGGGIWGSVLNAVAPELGNATYSETTKMTGKDYVETALGISTREGGVFGINQDDTAWADMARGYENQINATGKTSPIYDSILKGMQSGEQFKVRDKDGKVLDLATFKSQNKNWQDLLADESSGYQIASLDASKQEALSNATGSTRGQIISDLGWGTGDQLASGQMPGASKNDVHSEGAMGEFDLGEKTINRLGQLMRDAQAD